MFALFYVFNYICLIILCEVNPSLPCIASYSCFISNTTPLELITLRLQSFSVTRTYVPRRRRVRKGGSGSTFSTLLRKELREGALQSLLEGSSYLASSNSDPDPLLSSFMFNPVVADESVNAPHQSVEDALIKEVSKDDFLER